MWLLTKLVPSKSLDIGQVFFCEFMVYKNTKKEERGQYPAILTEQASSIKDLLCGIKNTQKGDLRGNFCCGTQRVIPSGQDSTIWLAWLANHSAGFGSSC